MANEGKQLTEEAFVGNAHSAFEVDPNKVQCHRNVRI